MRRKIASDGGFRLDLAFSAAVRRSLGSSKGGRSWETLVGYSLEALKIHLEQRFQRGMSWENYGRGGWHIDHIIPRSAFNYQTPQDIDFKRCWALENLQPLWEFDNISKGAKLDGPFQPSLALPIPANDNQCAVVDLFA
ncbi:HNH endonuclease signature motif containing protein [Shinella zoogloeoides]|uniref:HNH endonuclease signature motif containing protein n=1 Tax=Shinella zoogloeoides TaxID=352475 RepID=UPI001F58CDDA|nr:HNH endonuclease signature motif containing protein [Shinella zoogloeoides]